MRSRAQFERRREDEGGRYLSALAVGSWFAMLVFAYWNQQYVYARTDAPLAIPLMQFILMAVAVPFTIGAWAARRWRTSAHPVRRAAAVAAVVQLGTMIAMVPVIAILSGPERFTALFEVGEYFIMNLIGGLLAVVVFSAEAALMGSAGGAAMRYVDRRSP